MNQSTTHVNAPTITLVDIDGGPVAVWEKDAPVVPPFDPDEETDPSEWPAAYDNWRWAPTEGDPGRLDGDVRDFDDWLSQADRGYPPDDQDPTDFPVGRPMAPSPCRFSAEGFAAVARIALS